MNSKKERGVGNQGRVFAAYDGKKNKPVAIKLIKDKDNNFIIT
jgi:hypothetical protein